MAPPFKLGLTSIPLFAAEATFEGVQSNAIGGLLVSLAALAVLIGAIWNMVDRLRGGKAEKREISFSEEFATKEELTQAHGRIGRERNEINSALTKLDEELRGSNERLAGSIDSLRLEFKTDDRGVHNRINEVLAAVSELRGMLKKR